MSSSETLRVDAAVQPAVPDDTVLRSYMAEPFRSRMFPALERWFYPAPRPEHRLDAEPRPGANPGSDPELLIRHVLDDGGADLAVLVPQTRGLLPDIDLASEVCAATNRWLAEQWLEHPGAAGRLLGTIRVNPQDPGEAVREIERWANHPQMVQVAVTMQSHAPYGQRRFHPIWDAAQQHGLPVAILNDQANATELKPTYAGYPSHFVEYAAQVPLNYIYHLLSLLVEGVFDRFEDLVVVFGDGGLDFAVPLLWRFDKDWRPSRIDLPWIETRPMKRLGTNLRFCLSGFEGPPSAELTRRWLDIEHGGASLMWSSNYPSVRPPDPAELAELPDELRDAVLGGTAAELYGLKAPAAAPTGGS
jgi:predicted TIM-barrel fold metal-dependent hydrolase